MVYSRYTNPTVSMFQDRLAALEGAESCVATASGMAAILATAMVAPQGRRPRGVLERGVRRHHPALQQHPRRASASRPATFRRPRSRNGRRRCGKNTRLFFLETPSNPLTEISDIAALAQVAKKRGRAARGRQRVLHAGAAAAARARRRPRDPLRDQVPRRAGPGDGRRGAAARRRWWASRWSPFLRTAGPGAVAVQRLGDAEGPGDAGAAHAARSRRRRSSSRAGCRRIPRWRASTTPGCRRIRSTSWRSASSARRARCCRSK